MPGPPKCLPKERYGDKWGLADAINVHSMKCQKNASNFTVLYAAAIYTTRSQKGNSILLFITRGQILTDFQNFSLADLAVNLQ